MKIGIGKIGKWNSRWDVGDGDWVDVPGKKVKRVRHVRDGVLRGVKTYKFFFSGEEESKQSE